MGVPEALDGSGALQLVDDRDHRRAIDPLAIGKLALRKCTLVVENRQGAEALRRHAERGKRIPRERAL